MITNKSLSLTIRSLVDGKEKVKRMMVKKYIYIYTYNRWILVVKKYGLTSYVWSLLESGSCTVGNVSGLSSSGCKNTIGFTWHFGQTLLLI